METSEFGLLNSIECKLVKFDPVLLEKLVAKTGVDIEEIKEMMRYNILTFNQFSQLTGLTIATITNKTKPSIIDGHYNTELDYCFPFRDLKKKGLKFIVRNDKSEKYLQA